MNKIIITICYTGNSAGVTAGLLVGLGYKAYDLWGGMANWNNATSYSYNFANSELSHRDRQLSGHLDSLEPTSLDYDRQ